MKKRFYRRERDYERVYQLLVETYKPGDRFRNWLPSRWEYMHFHSDYKDEHAENSGIWEDSGKIVAVVHNELDLGEAFFTVHPDYEFLKPEMLDHAEHYLTKLLDDGTRKLTVYGNDFDEDLSSLFSKKAFIKQEKHLYYYTICLIKESPIVGELPEGFKLKSLAEDNDLVKVDRVQWRGFNHEGESPEEGVAERELMQSAPNFRKDLTVVVEEPNGEFVSYVGMWLMDELRVGYVEPVCTDPDYRRMGLGKIAVQESICRCMEAGAETVVVESSLPIYLSCGFQPKFVRYPWVKSFS
ncbi:GNAT family N-acetyltransferase [Evansella sp. AB-rgal1]|uniref:GNAT family N-acetyltransferase n=1 Tax=Evansella sp. AB-rgal1 TaxID=3242696 RepID=UPI00359CC052